MPHQFDPDDDGGSTDDEPEFSAPTQEGFEEGREDAETTDTTGTTEPADTQERDDDDDPVFVASTQEGLQERQESQTRDSTADGEDPGDSSATDDTQPTGVDDGGGPAPTDPASPAGTAVTGTEARRVAEGEIDVQNLEDRPALVSALSRMGFPDIRGSGIPRDLDRAIDQGLVTVGIEGGRLETELTEEGFRQRAQAQELRQARIAAEEGETAVSIRDLSAERRTELGRQFESRLEDQLGVDVAPGRDFTLEIEEQTEEGVVFGAEFTDTFRQRRRQLIGQQAEADIEAAVGRSRLSRLGFGDQFVAAAGTAGTIEGGRRVTPEMARQFADLEAGEDFTVDIEQMGDGFAVRAGLTETFEERELRQAAATQIERQTGMPVDPQQDIKLDSADRPQLSEGAQEELEQRLTGDEFEREVRDVPVPSVAAPFIGSGERQEPGPIPGFTRVPLGTLPGVSEEEATLEDIIGGTLDVVGEAADRQAEDFAFTRGVSPLAAGAIVGRPETLPAGREIEQDVDSPAQEQAERFLEGGGGLLGAPVSIAGGLEELREFGLETVERAPRQPLSETGQFVGEEAVETGDQTLTELVDLVESPGGRAQLAGSLAFSAGVFGAARAIGPRASGVTRAAIQPGEEALGIGGFAATRRLAGRGAAQRFFPQREPLIFSEEAAIIGARRGAGAARRGLGRIQSAELDLPSLPGRAELSSLSTEARAQARSVPINLAIRQENLLRRIRQRGDPSSFRQAMVRGDIEADDIRGVEPDDIDIPVESEGGEPSGAGVGASGVTFELERQTESGVVVEQVRAEFEQRGGLEMEPVAESELLRETETGRRFESAIEPLSESLRPLESRLSDLETPQVGELLGQELASQLEVGTELELEAPQEFRFELEAEQEAEAEAEVEQEFEFEIESELEQKAEVESEVEKEFEVEPFRFDLFGEDAGAPGVVEAFGSQRITEFGSVAVAVGVDVPGGLSLDDETTEQILDGPASPSGFDPMPFEGDQMLDLGAPTVTGLDGPAAVPPGGELPASVSNAIFDERDNRPLF